MISGKKSNHWELFFPFPPFFGNFYAKRKMTQALELGMGRLNLPRITRDKKDFSHSGVLHKTLKKVKKRSEKEVFLKRG